MNSELMIAQYRGLIESTEKEISILANTSAFINQMFDDISWVGFYLAQGDSLYLSAFQGKVACTKIPFNKGVCGTSASTKQTIIVDDVHKFEGHIACDSASNSEIVVPIIVNDEVYGVLDLDSTSFNRFSKCDQEILEDIITVLIERISLK